MVANLARFLMSDTRYIKLLKACKDHAPFLAKSRLDKFLTRREELTVEYIAAKKDNDTDRLQKITNEGLEVKEYIQALT